MEYVVELAKLPAEMKFPDRLRDRIRFEADRGRLVFQGFMTKCTYDELSALTDDVAYHRALEQLFVLTSAEMSRSAPRHGVPAAAWIAAAGTTVLLLMAVWVAWRHTSRGPAAAPPPDARLSTISR